jgi:hypothetical protein
MARRKANGPLEATPWQVGRWLRKKADILFPRPREFPGGQTFYVKFPNCMSAYEFAKVIEETSQCSFRMAAYVTRRLAPELFRTIYLVGKEAP